MLSAKWNTAVVLSATVAGVLFVASTGRMVLLLAIPLVPLLLFALANRNRLAMLAISLHFSGLYFFLLPMDMTFHHLFLALFAVSALGGRVIQPEKLSLEKSWPLALLFAFWMAVLILVRGHSISFLGSSRAGGAVYVHIAIAFLFFWYSGWIRLSNRQWCRALVAMIALIFVQLGLNLMVVLSGGGIMFPMMFLRATHALHFSLGEVAQGMAISRWALLQPVVAIYLLPIYLWPEGVRRVRLRYLVCFGLSLLVALLSGFRTSVTRSTLFVMFYFVLHSTRPLVKLVGVGLGFLLLTSALVFWVDYLPTPFQRVLTMVPGVQVSRHADISAYHTMLWRRELWHRAIREIPRYAIIGRGFGYDPVAYQLALQGARQGSVWASTEATFIGGHMHQGGLDLLLFLGVPGTLILLLWTGLLTLDHLRQHWTRSWNDPVLQRYHYGMTILLLVHVIQFLVFEGRIQAALPEVLFLMGVVHALAVNDLGRGEDIEAGL